MHRQVGLIEKSIIDIASTLKNESHDVSVKIISINLQISQKNTCAGFGPIPTGYRRLQDVLTRSWRLTTKANVVTTSVRRGQIYGVSKTLDLRRLEGAQYTMSWRRLIYNVLKTSDLRHLDDVGFTTSWWRPIYDVLKTSVNRSLCTNVVKHRKI